MLSLYGGPLVPGPLRIPKSKDAQVLYVGWLVQWALRMWDADAVHRCVETGCKEAQLHLSCV